MGEATTSGAWETVSFLFYPVGCIVRWYSNCLLQCVVAHVQPASTNDIASAAKSGRTPTFSKNSI